jgi:hypothetical protein
MSSETLMRFMYVLKLISSYCCCHEHVYTYIYRFTTFISCEFFSMILSASHSYGVSSKMTRVFPFFLKMKLSPASKIWGF